MGGGWGLQSTCEARHTGADVAGPHLLARPFVLTGVQEALVEHLRGTSNQIADSHIHVNERHQSLKAQNNMKIYLYIALQCMCYKVNAVLAVKLSWTCHVKYIYRVTTCQCQSVQLYH